MLISSARQMSYVHTAKNWLTVHLGFKSFVFVLIAVFGLAAFFRFWAAPLSTGPDVVQFWSFANAFDEHGIEFYQYADATDGSFAYWGWGYVYPPLWLLILGLVFLFCPSSTVSTELVDESWRLAMKTPIIAADLAIGMLIFWAVPGSKWKKLVFAGIWLLHPTAWYESSVFGQFDSIAAAFLLASLIMFIRGNHKLAFLFAALAFMTKQHTLFPIVMMIAISTRHMNIRQFLSNSSIFASVVAVFSIPFLVTGNLSDYAHSVMLPQWDPDYQSPLMYAFSGSSSLLTYLHNTQGWETKEFFSYNIYILAAAMAAALSLTRIRSITYAQAALIGILLFIGISYQVNYQYVIIFIPIALIVAARTNRVSERIYTIALAILPAVWLWMYDVAFWFRAYKPAHPSVSSIFENFGWTTYLSSDRPYVIFALTLMLTCLIYVVSAFLYWHHPKPPQSTIPASVPPSSMVE